MEIAVPDWLEEWKVPWQLFQVFKPEDPSSRNCFKVAPPLYFETPEIEPML
jgi:hypothetical protein